MSILDRLKGAPKVNRRSAFLITRRGSDKLQDMNTDARSRVLMALETGRGSQSLNSLAQAAHLSPEQTASVLQQLLSQQMVTQTADLDSEGYDV